MGVLLYREHIVCGIAAVKGAKCVGMLPEQGANFLWDYCCKERKLYVGLLL